jgi:hypothetical protein
MIDSLIQQYVSLLEDVDNKFQYAMQNNPEIPCKAHCTECCQQIFPLSIIEAYYISEGFKNLPRKLRRELEKEAAKKQEKLEKTLAFSNYEILNTNLEDIADRRNLLTHDMQALDIDCPLLNHEGLCTLYEHRNHDCRVHGGAYAQDPGEESGEIIGCFRHKKISEEKFRLHAIPHNYRYKEKNKLDSLTIIDLTKNPELANIKYITTPYIPLLKDFSKVDWKKLFEEKLEKLASTQPHDPTKLSLIIDTTY